MIATNGCTQQHKNVDAAQVVLDNIASRKSVRSYTSEPVPDEMVEKLLRAAMAAPSAMNTQPWEFVVVRDRATLDALGEGLTYAKMLKEATLAVVVCGDKSRERWVHDASAATENLLLAAEALGLGAVWTAADDPVRSSVVRDVLGVPDNMGTLCVIAIGFPSKEEKPKDKWKPEKIHYEKW